MSRDIDALTSYALTHLRDRWWTARWTHWVGSHLRCDPGERLVHVGCGNGEIDVALGLATPGLSVVSVDVHASRARHTRDLGVDVAAKRRLMHKLRPIRQIQCGSARKGRIRLNAPVTESIETIIPCEEHPIRVVRNGSARVDVDVGA